jgi:hypothetical protein
MCSIISVKAFLPVHPTYNIADSEQVKGATCEFKCLLLEAGLFFRSSFPAELLVWKFNFNLVRLNSLVMALDLLQCR